MFDQLDTLDSRALRRTDCYGQRFMRAGTYAYHVLPSGGQHVDPERPYIVRVTERKDDKAQMNQLTLTLTWNGRDFVPDKREVSVNAGDLVVWNCPTPGAPPYEVVGEKDFFNSARMVNECGFSHAFGFPGTYTWGDAFGSGLGGTIRVRDPGCRTQADLAKWRAGLTRATLVMIANGKAEPAEVDITVGQTVYFAIVTGKGISITDRRLHTFEGCSRDAAG
jgi:plastocyanin